MLELLLFFYAVILAALAEKDFFVYGFLFNPFKKFNHFAITEEPNRIIVYFFKGISFAAVVAGYFRVLINCFLCFHFVVLFKCCLIYLLFSNHWGSRRGNAR